MANTDYIGESLSFFQLFADKKLKIEVPIIQRDYAQGRSSEVEVRSNFLEALFRYLEEGKPGRELDFVYGAISENDNVHSFVPLDGQQRLTTLFLLHWYLSVISGNVTGFRHSLIDGNKSLFTYETRTSTSEFCTSLLTKNLPYTNFQPPRKISDVIRNEGWYFKAWDLDPSIASMLQMLDAIEERFHEHPPFYQSLISLKAPIIVFQFLNLKQFGLTDDLYIKMNSRGKPLNSFENFKAKLEQKILISFKGSGIQYHIEAEGSRVSKTPWEYFSHQIDTNWLNYFWNVGGKDAKMVDTQLMNFIRVILSNYYATSAVNYSGENLRILFKTQDAKYGQHDKENLSFFSYESLGSLFPKSLENMINSFDCLLRINQIEPDTLPDKFYYDHSIIFSNVINDNLTSANRILFHAFIGYLILHKKQFTGIKDWMRVVFNLVENTRLEDTADVKNALKSVEEMLSSSNCILQALADQTIQITFFYSRQVEEERVKACLIGKSSKWANKIYEVEQHGILRGQIGFILEFAGVLDYYCTNSNCSWMEGKDEEYFASFCDYADKAIATFDYLKNRIDSNYLWERAVLVKGDYLLPSSYYRYHFLTTTALTDRDNSWKRLLRLNLDTSLDVKRRYVRDVYDDKRFDIKDIESSCKVIIKDNIVDWRSFFIQQPELIAYCGRGFIRKESDLKIQLLETTKLTYHYELRTIALYLDSIRDYDWSPLSGTRYFKDYGTEGESHIYIGDFTINSDTYDLRIYFDEVSKYSLHLRTKPPFVQPHEYDPSIIALCMAHQFSPNDWRGYLFACASEEEILLKVTDLLADLENIL